MKLLRSFAFVVIVCAAASLCSAQSWQPLTNQPSFTAGHMLLLTDGTVMVHHEDPNDGYSDWWKLTPDINGSYVNGTWTQLASLASNYGPLFFGSAVLADGRVLVEGGEQNFSQYVWTNMGAIYDPIANTWTSVNPPSGWSSIGDASSVVLFNKTFMLANCCDRQQALFDETNLTWTSTGSGKFDSNNEEGWTLLPSGNVLTVDAYTDVNDPTGTNSEIYNAGSGSWSSAGSTVVQLWDSHGSYEVGPAMLRPDGTVFATGANGDGAGHTSIYTLSNQTWTPGPDFPDGLDIADGPAALLPDGNVLVSASPGIFEHQHLLLRVEWQPADLRAASAEFAARLLLVRPPAGSADGASALQRWQQRRRGLHAERQRLSRPDANHAPQQRGAIAWQLHRALRLQVQRRSQANSYGDDAQAATNYPIVRITNKSTGHVFYCRTHDHNTMAVGYNGPTYTHLDIPSNMESGASYLEVVVNGIASQKYSIGIN